MIKNTNAAITHNANFSAYADSNARLGSERIVLDADWSLAQSSNIGETAYYNCPNEILLELQQRRSLKIGALLKLGLTYHAKLPSQVGLLCTNSTVALVFHLWA